MSEENVELARVYHDEVARAAQEGTEATVSKMTELWAPEVVYDMSESPALDIGGVYRGVAACQRLVRGRFSAWQTLQFDYKLVDARDRAVVLLDTRWHGRPTWSAVQWRVCAALA